MATVYRWGKYKKKIETYTVPSETKTWVRRNGNATTDYKWRADFRKDYLEFMKINGLKDGVDAKFGDNYYDESLGSYTYYWYELVTETAYHTRTKAYRGSKLSTVTSTNRNAYPNDGESGDYWYVYEGIANEAPTISGSNLDLGSKQDDFSIEYIVSDADKNNCTVDILVDNVNKISNKSINLNTKYTYEIKLNEFTLGRHNVKIIAKDSMGATSERVYTFNKSNTAPVISGEDTGLGEKSTAFTINYRVSDRNNDNVAVTVTFGDLEIANVSSAQNKELSVTISDKMLEPLEIGTSHVITIKADDGKGGVAYRRYTFIKSNRPPIISNSDEDLGKKKESFNVNYSITDVEHDKIYSRVYLDDVLVREDLEVVDSKSYSYKIPEDVFLELKYGKHEIKIVAWDDNSIENKQIRKYTFERVSIGLEVEIKINEFDVKPKKIIGVPHGIFASDSIMKVYACNNYNDSSPTWEEMTTESKAARAFSFTNNSKSSSKWAIGLKIIVENGKSNVGSVLRGVKGGYE